MKTEGDKIVIESREEIDELQNALESFLKENPEAKERETVERLNSILESMWYSW